MKKIRILIIISVLFTLASLSFLLYPTISNAVNSLFNSSRINSYSKNVSTISENMINQEIKAAEAYNKKIAERVSFSYSPYAPIQNYDDILNFDDVLGYVEIPSISVKLPIYHGTVDNVLTKGVAHLPNTSFPIGGDSTHSVLSAHTGYPSQVFFDNLPDLKNGDLIFINILDRHLTYVVVSSEVVDPEDTSLLEVEENKDLLSLITCYPYGINSHRLIVTAERSDTPAVSSESSSNDFSIIYVITAITVVSIIFFFIVLRIIRKNRKGRESNA